MHESLSIELRQVFDSKMSSTPAIRDLSRRDIIRSLGATGAIAALSPLAAPLSAAAKTSDSKPMQLYKSMSDEQRKKVCLPLSDPRRQFVSNWWYIHKEHRIHNTFTADQQDLIQTIFDSLHNAEHRDAINLQVKKDQYGKASNTPAIGFFGSPNDKGFEFVYTGHHVTRRCNAHTDQGIGFGGAPVFYGHFDKQFKETKEHRGNPYWYQGKIFNEFIQALDGKQQAKAIAGDQPRKENSKTVIQKKQSGWDGLSCAELSPDQKAHLVKTMRRMLKMFRADDVEATIQSIQRRGMIDRLFVSCYDGKFDLASDREWDTWQIEGPEMVWYFRGYPHIHTYLHIKA